MFKRDLYLKHLISSLDNGLIKVISGTRRAGKSFLLNNIFYNYLIERFLSKVYGHGRIGPPSLTLIVWAFFAPQDWGTKPGF